METRTWKCTHVYVSNSYLFSEVPLFPNHAFSLSLIILKGAYIPYIFFELPAILFVAVDELILATCILTKC